MHAVRLSRKEMCWRSLGGPRARPPWRPQGGFCSCWTTGTYGMNPRTVWLPPSRARCLSHRVPCGAITWHYWIQNLVLRQVYLSGGAQATCWPLSCKRVWDHCFYFLLREGGAHNIGGYQDVWKVLRRLWGVRWQMSTVWFPVGAFKWRLINRVAAMQDLWFPCAFHLQHPLSSTCCPLFSLK